MFVSIIIKCLNEEEKIAEAVESALDAISELDEDGEVIVADSLSTDRTIEICKQMPVRIVQLENKEERSCGVGAEIGYRVASGEFIYILDGDMKLDKLFISEAIKFLRANPEYAGLAGTVVELNQNSKVFSHRQKRDKSETKTQQMKNDVGFLAMGGLYRKSALEEIGYFTNRNLRALEELELGTRLQQAGWKLARINNTSVYHYGHDEDMYALLWKRIKTGYILGIGQVLKAAFNGGFLLSLVKFSQEIKVYSLYLFWQLATLIVFLVLGIIPGLIFLFTPFVALSIKKRSISFGVYSVFACICFSWAMIIGFVLARQVSPDGNINVTSIQ